MRHIPLPEISFHRQISANGERLTAQPSHVSHDDLVACYRTMVLIRLFDRKAVALQRTGQMGTYPSCLGQEAISTAIGHTMKASDVFVPYYRDQATQYLRGVPLHRILAYWGGEETGNVFEGNAQQDLPNCVPIATQLSHAAGIAAAFKVRGEHRAVVVTCGDGATSRGDFYEAINVAGAWQLPMVVVVNNNQWAISVPRRLQSNADTLAHKAYAAGIDAYRVDGNDAEAMLDVMHEALETAWHGKGATLIEAVSYRLGDHTTADDASRYRSSEELNHAWEQEPVKRLQTYLYKRGLWDETRETQLVNECHAIIQREVDAYLALAPQPPEAFFDHLYARLPDDLAAQRDNWIKRATQRGGSHHGR